MKYERGTFIVVPNREALAGLPPHVQAVFLWLCFFANQDGECFPSRATLSAKAGVSLRTVDSSLKVLEQKAFIEKKNRKDGNEKISNLYTVLVGGVEQDVRYLAQDVREGSAESAPGGSAGPAHRTNSIKELNISNYSFEVFWEKYPKKVDKKKAESKWAKIPEKTRAVIIGDIELRKESDSWKRGYVPHPTTYLNGERWNDEITKGPVPSGAARQNVLTL